MAKKTFGQMFSKIVRQVGLTNTFNDDLEETESIKEDINDIQIQVLSLSKTYLKKAGILISGGTVVGQKAYDMPTNVDKITLVKITVDSRDYFPVRLGITDFNKLSNTEQSSDIPVYYTIDKTQVVIFPTPETASLPIELNANEFATDLETDPGSSDDINTELEIKKGCENTIYYYCLTEAYARQEDWASHDRYDKKFEVMEKKHKNEVKNPTNSIVVKSSTTRGVNPNYYNIITN